MYTSRTRQTLLVRKSNHNYLQSTLLYKLCSKPRKNEFLEIISGVVAYTSRRGVRMLLAQAHASRPWESRTPETRRRRPRGARERASCARDYTIGAKKCRPSIAASRASASRARSLMCFSFRSSRRLCALCVVRERENEITPGGEDEW